MPDPREMAHSAEGEIAPIGSRYADPSATWFGARADQDSQIVLANTGKLLADCQDTLITPPTAFYSLHDALDQFDLERPGTYP